jgi:hypothetical protein
MFRRSGSTSAAWKMAA